MAGCGTVLSQLGKLSPLPVVDIGRSKENHWLNCMKNRAYFFLFASLLLALSACSSSDFVGLRPVTSEYCDNFLVYDMCARDTNRDGVVDVVYFTDTDEVFMYREGMQGRFPRNLEVHQCAQQMDDDLVATTSRLFFIDEETSFLEKQDIRGAMMIKYIAYMPRVSACNMQAAQDESAT